MDPLANGQKNATEIVHVGRTIFKRRGGPDSSGSGKPDAQERKGIITQSSGRESRTFSFTTGRGSRNGKLK